MLFFRTKMLSYGSKILRSIPQKLRKVLRTKTLTDPPMCFDYVQWNGRIRTQVLSDCPDLVLYCNSEGGRDIFWRTTLLHQLSLGSLDNPALLGSDFLTLYTMDVWLVLCLRWSVEYWTWLLPVEMVSGRFVGASSDQPPEHLTLYYLPAWPVQSVSCTNPPFWQTNCHWICTPLNFHKGRASTRVLLYCPDLLVDCTSLIGMNCIR